MGTDGGKNGGVAPRASIKSTETAFRIVTALQDLDGAGVTELAEYTGLAKSTVSKHLSTLWNEELVARDDDQYRLGLRFLDIGGYVREHVPGAQIIQPRLEELADETGEVVQFTVEEHGRGIVIYRLVGHHGVATRSRVGKRMYLHQTAAGKAILAFLPPDKADAIVDLHGLPKATEATITDREAFAAELDAVRDRGYAFNRGEITKGLHAVAAPVRAADGSVIGACVVTGPSHRMKGERFEVDIPDRILSAVNEMELNIAHARGPFTN